MKNPSRPYLALIGALLFATTAQAKIVCWTNNEGIRECGNAVPPEYAQKETRTLNKRGMITDVQQRAKTPEELAAEEARETKEKLRLEEEERQRETKQRHDRMLLSTYLTEEDIISSRDRKSNLFDASIEVTQVTINKLQEKLDEDLKQAEKFTKRGKEPGERLQQDIEMLKQQIAEKNSYIQKKEQEKRELHQQYDADIKRFRELKGISAKKTP